MTIPVKLVSNQSNVVIDFSIKQSTRHGCNHPTIVVDEFLGEVECETCGEKINAVQFLLRMAKQEIRWRTEADRMEKLKKEVESRCRCKCQHCGKITRI